MHECQFCLVCLYIRKYGFKLKQRYIQCKSDFSTFLPMNFSCSKKPLSFPLCSLQIPTYESLSLCFPQPLATFPASVLFGLLFSLFLLCPASWILAAAELLSNGVQRLALLRTNNPISTHNVSRPYSPFRHHFIPYVKGKKTGHSS